MSTIPYISTYRSILSPTYIRSAVRRANRAYYSVFRSSLEAIPIYPRSYYAPRYTARSYSSVSQSLISALRAPTGYSRSVLNPNILYFPPIRRMPRYTYRVPSTYATTPISSSYRGLNSPPRTWYTTTPIGSRYLALTEDNFIDYDSELSKVTKQLSRTKLQGDNKSTSTTERLFPSSFRQMHVHLPHSPSKKLGSPTSVRRSGGGGYRSTYARQYASRLQSATPRAHWSSLY